MPREGAITFSDLVGKLGVLRIECGECGRAGRYRLVDLITRYDPYLKLFAFTDEVTANCARTHARSDNDPAAGSIPICPRRSDRESVGGSSDSPEKDQAGRSASSRQYRRAKIIEASGLPVMEAQSFGYNEGGAVGIHQGTLPLSLDMVR
jgi:hypothetical protein